MSVDSLMEDLLCSLTQEFGSQFCLARNTNSLLRSNGGDIDCFLPEIHFKKCYKSVSRWIASNADIQIVMKYQSPSCLAVGLVFSDIRYVVVEFFDGVMVNGRKLIPFEMIQKHIMTARMNVLPRGIGLYCGFKHYQANGKLKYGEWSDILERKDEECLQLIAFISEVDARIMKKENRLKVLFFSIYFVFYTIINTKLFQGKIVRVEDQYLDHYYAEIENYHVLSPKFRCKTRALLNLKVFMAWVFGSMVVYSGSNKCVRRSISYIDIWN